MSVKPFLLTLGVVLFFSASVLSAPEKRIMDIIIGGENFCKNDDDCKGETKCHLSSHICVACPTPFIWTGTECVCPDDTVLMEQDGKKSCVECVEDTNCHTLKGDTNWYCNTATHVCQNCLPPKEWHADTNTCECPSDTVEENGLCVCDNTNKALDTDGYCQCQIQNQTQCDEKGAGQFMEISNCDCCPLTAPIWNGQHGEQSKCLPCPSTEPNYNATTHRCECNLTQASCAQTDFNTAECMCCPVEAPVYDSASGTCKTCVEMHPEWIETGATYDITTKQCWPYCGEEEFGVIMLVDRSGSTKATCSIKRTLEDGTTQTLHCCDLITEALESLVIPENMKVAMYLNSGSVGDGDIYRVLSYGYHGADAVKNAIPQWVKMTGSYTTFEPALEDITENICPTGDNLVVMMWTDGELIATDAAIKKMKEACKNVKFYYIGPSENTFSAYYAGYYAIKSLPDTYASHLNDVVRQEGCILKDSDGPTDSENFGNDGVYGDEDDVYVCSNLRHSPITTKETCDSCGAGVRVWRSAAKDCISCRYASGFASTKAECSECNGRYFSGSKESSGTCYLCDNVSQYPSATEQECDSCGAGVRVWRSAKKDCISCDYASHFTSTKDECLECDNRYFIGTNDSSGTCYSCDNTSQSPATSEQECDFCGEGIRVWRSSQKDCISCDYTADFTSTKNECLECNGRYFVGSNDSSGACYSCDNTSQSPATSEQECDSCGEGTRVWRSSQKDCISCGYTSKFSSTRDECLECSNRYFSGGYCYSCFDLTASNAKNITDKNNCLSCEQAVWTDEGICAYCPSDSQNAERTKCEGNYLGLDNIYYACDNISQYKGSSEQECDSCGEGTRVWRSAKKDCISCGYTSKFSSTRDECLECSNRYFSGSYCYSCVSLTVANAKNITDKNSCLNCAQSVWTDEGICAYCPSDSQNAERTKCEGNYLGTDNVYYACDNASQHPTSSEQECDSCGEGVRMWRSAYKNCISCNYASAFTSTKAECLECPNRYWKGTNERSGTCYRCSEGETRNDAGVCE